MIFNVPNDGSVKLYIIVADPLSVPMVPTKAGVPFKVGLSRNPHARLSQVQTGCPFKLSLYYSDLSCGGDFNEFEKQVHRRLSHLALKGEWFFGDPDEAYQAACAINQESGDRAWEEYQGARG